MAVTQRKGAQQKKKKKKSLSPREPMEKACGPKKQKRTKRSSSQVGSNNVRNRILMILAVFFLFVIGIFLRRGAVTLAFISECQIVYRAREAATTLLGALAGERGMAEEVRKGVSCGGPQRSVVGTEETPLRVVAPLGTAREFPLEAVRRELANVANESWHHKSLPYQASQLRGWSAIGLRTVDGDDGPNSVYHGHFRPEVNYLNFRDTPFAALIMPIASEWIKAAVTDESEPRLRGVRLLRLNGHQHLLPHWDHVLGLGGTRENPIQFTQARFTVLLQGSHIMCFSSGMKGEEGPRGKGGSEGLADQTHGCYAMEPGVMYYANIGVKHEVFVTSEEDRVVLVADIEPSDTDIARICEAPVPPRRVASPLEF